MKVINKGANLQFKIHHCFLQPDSIEKSFNWDVYSIIAYQKYLFSELFETDTINLTIQHYYEGKPLLDKPFKFQIAKRYEPLLKVSAKKIKKSGLIEDFDRSLAEAKIALFEAVNKFNPAKGPPANYFDLYLKEYYPGNLFDNLSTEAGDVPCNDDCKNEKASKKELPCKFETEAGFCRNPKKKRRLTSMVEIPESSYNKLINSEDDDTTPLERLLNIKSKEEYFSNLYDGINIDPKKETLLKKIQQDDRLKEILKKLDAGINIVELPENDRQYYYRFKNKEKKTNNKS